jgi:hypothetical protein
MSENVDAAPDDQRISFQVLSGEHLILDKLDALVAQGTSLRALIVSVFRDRGDELSLGDRSF